jgi:thioredoxin-like negative regulator of GroEL
MAKGTGPEGGPWATTGLEVLRTADFADGTLSRPGTYVVCFGAAWCPVTRRFMPHFIALQSTVPATVAIADITDLNDPLWDDFRIRITPSIIVFRDGNLLLRVDGRRFLGITRSALEKLHQSILTG